MLTKKKKRQLVHHLRQCETSFITTYHVRRKEWRCIWTL